VSKNNTGSLPLRGILPVKTEKNITNGYGDRYSYSRRPHVFQS